MCALDTADSHLSPHEWHCLFLFQYKQGKVGPDGKELIPQESPKVNGYGFVATPSPAPGKRVCLFFLM